MTSTPASRFACTQCSSQPAEPAKHHHQVQQWGINATFIPQTLNPKPYNLDAMSCDCQPNVSLPKMMHPPMARL